MGAAIISRIELITTLGEVAGFKSGLTLTKEQIIEHLPDHAEVLSGVDEEVLRVRSEEYEEMFVALLHSLGVTATSSTMPPGLAFYARFKGDAKKQALAEKIIKVFLEKTSTAGSGPVDLTPFVEEAARRHGADGLELAKAFVDQITGALVSSPWSKLRRVDWADTAELKDLFESEGLHTQYGKFFDQRYIDYLSKNFDKVDEMHWRKFEALTAEHFEREGFKADLGPGRDDGNIDVRVYPKDAAAGLPPMIIVQCKRQKGKVEKVVVKALYADILDEGAKSGLIVTTSSLQPGAKEVCTARGYPIDAADRATVKKWIEAMRTPMSGVFLG